MGCKSGNMCAIFAAVGTCGRPSTVVWVEWIAEPSGSCTLIGTLAGTEMSALFLFGLMKCPVVPVSMI